MLTSLTKFYKWISLLSIDIAIGAGVSSVFFANMFNAPLRIFPVVILILTVWMIYTVDHLLDVSKANVHTLSTRRQFHFAHQHSMISFLFVCLVIVCILAFFLFLKVVIGGLILMISSICYFVFKDQIKGLKEFFSGLIYCCGILLAPTLNRVRPFSDYDIQMICAFGITVLINLVLFAYYDYSEDIRENHVSLATLIGIPTIKRVIIFLFTIQVILLCFLINHAVDRYPVFVIVLMNLVLIVLFLFKNRFERNNNFRPIGDGIFLIPIIYLIFH